MFLVEHKNYTIMLKIIKDQAIFVVLLATTVVMTIGCGEKKSTTKDEKTVNGLTVNDNTNQQRLGVSR